MRAAALLLALLPAGTAAAQTVEAARPIRAQSLISEGDLTVTEDVTPGAVSDLAEIVGKEARVTLYPGRAILIDQVGPPALIERNQQVKMSYADGPLSIMTEGRALDRGGVGETIRVMNLTSKQIVSGAVAADGSIKVTP